MGDCKKLVGVRRSKFRNFALSSRKLITDYHHQAEISSEASVFNHRSISSPFPDTPVPRGRKRERILRVSLFLFLFLSLHPSRGGYLETKMGTKVDRKKKKPKLIDDGVHRAEQREFPEFRPISKSDDTTSRLSGRRRVRE